MLPFGFRLPFVVAVAPPNLCGKRLFSIVGLNRAGNQRIYRSKRDRPLISEYKLKDKTVRMEAAQPEDLDMVADFMSEISVKQEPTSLSIGVTADEFRPFCYKIASTGIKYTMLFLDGDRLIAGGIGNAAPVNRINPSEPVVRDDYGKLIDEMESWLPSRKMRRVVAPAYDLCNMVSHFVPKDVEKIMRYDLACVHSSVTGGNMIRKMIYELSMMALRDGMIYGDAQTTASASHRAHTRNKSKNVCFLPYDKMFDHGERIHKKVPLSDGSPGITEFILDLKDVAEKSKC